MAGDRRPGITARHRLLVRGATLAILLAGCADTTPAVPHPAPPAGTASPVPAPDPGPTPTADPRDPEEEPGDDLGPAPGPLTQLLRAAAPASGTDPASVIAVQTATENLVAVCMHDQGFDYWPQAPDPGNVSAGHTGPEPGSRAFVVRYGYGVWEQPVAVGGGWTLERDPAAVEYLESMSEAEREAYDVALHGAIVARHPDGGISYTGEGCFGQVWLQPGRDEAERAYVQGFLDEIHRAMTEIITHPEVVELEREWSVCLRDAGYDAASPTAAREQVTDEYLAAIRASDGDLAAARTPERVAAELALALADLECREALDFDARSAALRTGLEQEWVDAHRVDVESFREVVDAWRGAVGLE